MISTAQSKIAFGFILCFLPFATTASAQQYAQLNGTVRDSTGAVAPGSSVAATNMETKVSRSVMTNDAGTYVLVNLQPGHYTVEVTKEGFQKATSDLLTLDVNQIATLDVGLKVGALTESVRVSAEAAMVDATSAQLGTVITQEKIAELPLNGRNFTQLLMLTPGASPVNTSQNNGGGQVAHVGIAMFPAMNGQSNRSNSFLLDGIYNNAHYASTYAIAPSVDALSEFKVQSHGDQAEFGGVSGAIVNIASRSGTNSFHGSAFEFMRNDALDARGFFTAVKPTLRQNQFGGSIGGPIKRDNTFFFFSYEGYRQKNPASNLYIVPTPAELGGNFSTYSRQIYNPFSTRVDPSNPNNYLRDPFPGNIVPASMIDPATKAWAAAIIPQPIDTGIPGYNGRNTSPQAFPSDQYSIRVDHQFSTRDFLWARYTWGEQNTSSAQTLQGTSTLNDRPSKNGGVGYNHTFGSATFFSALFGFTSLEQNAVNFLTNKDLIGSGVIKGMPPGLTTAPDVSLGYFGVTSTVADTGPIQGYQIRADLSKVVGSHTLKMGGETVIEPYNQTNREGAWGFSSLQTANLSSQGNTGYDVASFVLGALDNTLYYIKDYALRSRTWNAYVQDSWKVTPKLTVNLGVRWDLLINATYTKSFPSTWDFSTGKYLVGTTQPPQCSATQPAPCVPDPSSAYLQQYVVFTGHPKILSDDYKDFGPRLGFAYRVKPSMVVRGSYAIFYDLMAGVTQQGNNGNAKWPGVGVLSQSGLNKTTITLLADDPFGGKNPAIPANTPAAQTGFLFDPGFQHPYSEQWNMEIQKEFSGNILVSVGYVGSHNLRLPIGGAYNVALTPGPGAVSNRNLFSYAPVSNYDRSIGQGKYNALQLKAERRLGKGLSYLFAYTWSKSMDVASSGQFGSEGQSLQNPYDPNGSRSVSGFDVPHLFTGAALYSMPFGHGQRWLTSGFLSRILGNWQMNGIVSARSGQPFTPLMNLDIANIGALDGTTQARPNLVGDPSLSNPGTSAWFNTAAFAAPKTYTFGSAGRNLLRTQALRNIDLSVFREDALTEKLKLQIRAEAFNAFNQPTLGTPVTNFNAKNFGSISGTVSTARQIQLGMKLVF